MHRINTSSMSRTGPPCAHCGALQLLACLAWVVFGMYDLAPALSGSTPCCLSSPHPQPDPLCPPPPPPPNHTHLPPQVLEKGGKRMSFQNPNPFADGDGELASCAYKYRKWTLNAEEGLDVVGGGWGWVGGGGGEWEGVTVCVFVCVGPEVRWHVWCGTFRLVRTVLLHQQPLAPLPHFPNP